jgi:predicted Zn finger-like uncharacterized protein
MVSALSTTVVIACPHCGTRYQLPPEAIGPKGRDVACAHCGQTWHADGVKPQPAPRAEEPVFDESAERAADDAFEAAEHATNPPPATLLEDDRMRTIAEIKAAIVPKARQSGGDAAGRKKQQKDFNKRQKVVSSQLPLAKVRRVARIGGITILMAMIGGGIALRTDIVRQFPDLAGFYEALGLGVNVIGLEFRDVTTLVTLRGGGRVMQVDGRIFSVAARSVVVPPVVVTLLDGSGAPLYEWSVVPATRDLEPGEVVAFTTQLTAPPATAVRARLTFSDGRVTTDSPVVTAATTSE